MITSVQENYPYFVDEVLTFQSLQDQGSHPYQLLFIASLIAQEYNYRYKIWLWRQDDSCLFLTWDKFWFIGDVFIQEYI